MLANIWLLLFLAFPASAEESPLTEAVFSMPRNCQELLPEPLPFTNFLQSVARGLVRTEPKLAERIFKLLALGDRIEDLGEIESESNPVTVLIRKTLCFYRSKKGATTVIPYDDKDLIAFLKDNLKELETKVEDSIFRLEFEEAQKREFERKMEANQEVIDKMQRSAEKAAEKEFAKDFNNAQRKVESQ